MQIKLTHAEMQSLADLIWVILQNNEPQGNSGKLILAVLKKLYEKIAKALVVFQKSYKVRFDDITALAFVELFGSLKLNPTQHAHNLAIKLTNQFKQHYA